MALVHRMVIALIVSTSVAHAAPGPVRRGDDTRAKMADARLRGGYPLMAAEDARSCLADEPDNHDCRDVLARATTLAGRCDEALDALGELRDAGAWTFQLAIAEGTCHVRDGHPAAAIAAFDEAEFLKPLTSGPPLQRGLVHARIGDLEALDADIQLAWDNDAELWVIELLEIWRAWAAGDPALDGLLHAFHRWRESGAERNLLLHASLVDCYAWMAVDDPVMAHSVAELGVRVSRGHNRILACRSEAERRDGEARTSVFMLTRPWQTAKKAPIIDAVLARAMVDVGDFDGAQAVLEALSDLQEPDIVASWWYLARGRGDAAEMARLERAYATLAVPASLSLDNLIPTWETR